MLHQENNHEHAVLLKLKHVQSASSQWWLSFYSDCAFLRYSILQPRLWTAGIHHSACEKAHFYLERFYCFLFVCLFQTTGALVWHQYVFYLTLISTVSTPFALEASQGSMKMEIPLLTAYSETTVCLECVSFCRCATPLGNVWHLGKHSHFPSSRGSSMKRWIPLSWLCGLYKASSQLALLSRRERKKINTNTE